MKRKLLASAICANLLLVAGAAFAQDQPASTQQPDQSESAAAQSDEAKQEDAQTAQDDQVTNLGTVTVTGSLLKRPEYQQTVPVQVVNIDASQASGSFGTMGLLQSSSVAAGTTQINNQFSGFIVNGGTGVQSIDLRGVGAQRSLVLLDGQRPGPAGTRGAVGAFDLNVIPEVILQRVEIVKDGSSSIYGSDAIAGVVNLITRARMDHTEMAGSLGVTQHGGGEQSTASIGTGWNFSRGNIMVAAQVQQQNPLSLGDRSFLKCPQDLVWDENGHRIDRADHSVIGDTSLGGCSTGNLYANTILQYTDFGIRYVPSPDGTTIGPFPGYRPRQSGRYDDGNPDGAYYEDVLNYPFSGKEWVINKNRNSSLYAAARYSFDSFDWDTQLLYNNRKTETRGWRQFFPTVSKGPFTGDLSTVYVPIMPFPSNDIVNVNYVYGATKLSGLFASSDTWSWQVNATHSRSNGSYSHIGIDARVSGDLTLGVNTLGEPPIDYFDPGILSGARMDELVDAVGVLSKGHTTYKQSTINAVFAGDLFSMPAGPVASAFGVEYRHYSIDDQPSEVNSSGFEWGFTSAQTTKGTDSVKEVFGEIGIPLLKGKPGFDSLTVDLSARRFKYDSVGSAANVWKAGLNWQIAPAWRVRGTIGTSYRAPALYELYLGNQSGFVGQLGIDPCILWRDSSNDFIRQNCAADGIPDDYAGGASSAEIFQGGGHGFLKPETSRAKSLGAVWTPSFANFNLALDYFDYSISGEISTLGAGDIVFGCYGRPVHPNHFCDLFNRNPGSDPSSPFAITDIHATFININGQRARGYDLQWNYSQDLSFGKLSADAQVTYTIENSQQLFDSSVESGFETTNFVGFIGNPRTVGLAHLSLERGDWTYTWQGEYVSSTSNKDLDPVFSYFGYDNAVRDIKAGWQFRHSVSVGYDAGKWGVLFGIRNLFDKAPDLVSEGVATRKGNVPLVASQYDWFGRSLFIRANYSF